jgi:type I restriction enzyme S subunit
MAVPKQVALGEVAVIERDIVDPAEIKGGTLYVGLENIESGGRLVGVRPVDAGELASSKFEFTPRHLLYGKLRPYLAKIARPDFAGICSTDILPVLPGPDLDRGYLAWLLLTPEMVALASSRATGANLPRLSPNALAELRIPLPPLPEQRRIAEILDKADALRAKRRAALAHLDALAQSIFLDMIGDPATNPKGWPRRSLADVFDIARGGSPRPIDDFITESPDGINWVMIGDATACGGKFITRTKKRIKPEGARRSRAVKPGDFLLTNSMSFGRPYIMQTSGCIHDGWLVLSSRAEAIETEYFYTLLGSAAIYAEFVRLAPGATVKNLNIDLVRGVMVPVAPLELQREYARRVAEFDEVRGRLLAGLATMDELFDSIQNRAFSGTLAPIPT